MRPDEIKAKAATLAELYAAKVNGKTLQFNDQSIGWIDCIDNFGPAIQSDLTRWRVNPDPRRMQETGPAHARTHFEAQANEWKAKGCSVTEWMEVLP